MNEKKKYLVFCFPISHPSNNKANEWMNAKKNALKMRDAQNSIKNKSVFCTQYSIVVYASTHNFYSQTNIFDATE